MHETAGSQRSCLPMGGFRAPGARWHCLRGSWRLLCIPGQRFPMGHPLFPSSTPSSSSSESRLAVGSEDPRPLASSLPSDTSGQEHGSVILTRRGHGAVFSWRRKRGRPREWGPFLAGHTPRRGWNGRLGFVNRVVRGCAAWGLGARPGFLRCQPAALCPGGLMGGCGRHC